MEPHGFTVVVPFVCFGETRRACSAEVAIKATKAGSMSSFARLRRTRAVHSSTASSTLRSRLLRRTGSRGFLRRRVNYLSVESHAQSLHSLFGKGKASGCGCSALDPPQTPQVTPSLWQHMNSANHKVQGVGIQARGKWGIVGEAKSVRSMVYRCVRGGWG